MGWTPPTGSNGTGGGGDFPTAAPTVLVPRDWQKNQDQPVPGLGPDQAYQYSGGSANAAEFSQGQGQPVTLAQALGQLLVLGQTDTNGTRSLQEQLIQAGYLNPDPRHSTMSVGSVASGDSTYNAYAKLLNDAIVTGNSIYDILDHRAADPKNATGQRYWKTYLGVTGQAPMEKTYTSTATQYSTTGDAYKAAQDEYQQYLGRDANTKEVSALHAALNAYERAHPTQTTKDVTYDPSMGYGGLNEKNVTQSGGVSAGDVQQVADNQIKTQDSQELGQVQTDRLVSVFEQMLGNGNG